MTMVDTNCAAQGRLDLAVNTARPTPAVPPSAANTRGDQPSKLPPVITETASIAKATASAGRA
ncbi:MAG: hypothetical protein ABR564_06330 [Candidatus Dormibacteria bacterium]